MFSILGIECFLTEIKIFCIVDSIRNRSSRLAEAYIRCISHRILDLTEGKGSIMAAIKAVCISEKKGVQKHPVDEIELKVDWGIVGDAHAGNWHRQVSLLGQESVDKLQKKLTDITLTPGVFAENILVDGITLYELPVGTKLKMGENVLAEVTQIGKECHTDCAIRKAAGDCVMPREGIFVKILEPGVVKPGDALEII